MEQLTAYSKQFTEIHLQLLLAVNCKLSIMITDAEMKQLELKANDTPVSEPQVAHYGARSDPTDFV